MPLTRPPSLSDSFLDYNLYNEKENPLSPLSIEITQRIESFPIKKKEKTWNVTITRYALRFMFHILLIGFFETLFFFFFVSGQESNALSKDTNMFTQQLTSQCVNFTREEKQVFNNIINTLINTSDLYNKALISSQSREIYNQNLLIQAWMYEIAIFSIFIITAVYSKWKKITISWKRIFLENVALISFLALYEVMFFETIVFNFKAISISELEANALRNIESNC